MALARFVSALGRLAGWSPVGKRILLRIDNSTEATRFESPISGKLAAINPDGSAIVELHTPLVFANGRTERIKAIPRHTGYGFEYLWAGFISVDVVDQTGSWFAIGELTICRRHHKINGNPS